jgi:hypothetical protein
MRTKEYSTRVNTIRPLQGFECSTEMSEFIAAQRVALCVGKTM